MRRYVVMGNPVPQGRVRSFLNKKTGSIGHYDPEASVSWKNKVGWSVQNQHPDIISGPVIIKAVFCLKRPASLPKKVAFHTKKPDLDNLIKAVKDALKGLCWNDDAQVVKIIASKEYAVSPGQERVEIEIGTVVEEHLFS